LKIPKILFFFSPNHPSTHGIEDIHA